MLRFLIHSTFIILYHGCCTGAIGHLLVFVLIMDRLQQRLALVRLSTAAFVPVREQQRDHPATINNKGVSDTHKYIYIYEYSSEQF